MASQRNERATSSSRVGPSMSRSGEDHEVFARNQITFDEFKEAVILGCFYDSKNLHFPHPNRRPNYPREVGQMPMWSAPIEAGLLWPLHADVVELCIQLTIVPS
ncbi:hypothetical protein CRG98_036293 [Punica granatum]|uniref:Uncharacterized protein n=1 Tax=Punica granatum TaxID=22663 RepID=A0A2I0IHR4_PUNGR|nr:hypothetical protein CRG98_036293 [Punica granatum]